MSRTCGVNIELHTKNQGQIDLLELLMRHGWQPGFADEIMFLPLGDHDDFEWQIMPRDAWSEVFTIIKQKANAGESVGVDMVWEESDVGGSFHFSADERSARIWTVWNAYRPLLANCDWLTDHGWYLQRIIPPILNAGIQITLLESNDWY